MAELIVAEIVAASNDFVSETFGRLRTIAPKFRKVVNTKGHREWFQDCVCACGEPRTIRCKALKSGNTKSCGCLQRQRAKEANTTHGMKGTAEYRSWRHLRDRCDNPNDKHYPDYGARGIGYCDRWKKFENFLADVGRRPGPEYSIERNDTNGNYEPSNCRWATPQEQANNKRTNRMITIEDKTDTLANWCRAYGIKYKIVNERINRAGWDPLRALATPIRPTSQRLAAPQAE